MDVSSRITAAVSHLAAVGSAKPTEPQPGHAESTSTPAASEAGASAQLSRPAQLIDKLSRLRDSAPGQFKQAVSSIATELRNVSEQDSGMGAKLLLDLANKLDQAANDAGRTDGRGAAGSQEANDAGSLAEPADAANTANGANAASGEDAQRVGANRAAVEAYRATAEAHANGPAGRGAFARAIESVDAATAGAEPRRR